MVGMVLRFLWVTVIKTLEGVVDVGENGEVDLAVVVVPVQIQYQAVLTVPVAGDFVAFFKDGNEVVGMLLSSVLDTKVINK